MTSIARSKSRLMYQKNMFGLAWDVYELEELISMGRKLCVEMASLCDKLKGDALSREVDEVSWQIMDL